jgi:hypothetical protein
LSKHYFDEVFNIYSDKFKKYFITGHNNLYEVLTDINWSYMEDIEDDYRTDPTRKSLETKSLDSNVLDTPTRVLRQRK